jgi:hypothetical protein
MNLRMSKNACPSFSFPLGSVLDTFALQKVPDHCPASGLAHFRPIINTYGTELQLTPPCHDWVTSGWQFSIPVLLPLPSQI